MGFFEMKSLSLQQLIRRFYGFQFFFGLLLWVPIFYEFQKRMGLNETQIFSIQSFYYLAFCLLEIPTGLLADRMGHRACMISGSVVLVAAGVFPIFQPTYFGILIHFLLVALARSLISGASSAYLYDDLRQRGAADQYKKVEGNARAYGLAGKVILWAWVGMMMQWHLTAPYWVTLGASAIAVGFALALPPLRLKNELNLGSEGGAGRQAEGTFNSAPISGAKLSKRDLLGWESFKTVGSYFYQSPLLPLIMVQGVALFVLGRIVQVNLFQPLLSGRGFSVASYGVVMAYMTLFETGGSLLPGMSRFHQWRGRLSDLNWVFVFSLVLGFSVLLLISFGKWGVLSGLAIFSFIQGVSYPVQRQLINDAIPDSRYRATLLSIESILDRAVNAWVAAILASYVVHGDVDGFLRLSFFVTMGACGVLFGVARKFSHSLRTALN